MTDKECQEVFERIYNYLWPKIWERICKYDEPIETSISKVIDQESYDG